MDSYEFGARLLSSCMMGRRKKGNRKDGKVCDAKPGECRFNNKYYSPGMRDEKSWSMPSSDETCNINCGFLIDP